MLTSPYIPPPQLAAPCDVLVYLNKDWQEEWEAAGAWDKNNEGCEKKYCRCSTAASFSNTDADSFHGHPNPNLSEGKLRRSIALYYYSIEDNLPQGDLLPAKAWGGGKKSW